MTRAQGDLLASALILLTAGLLIGSEIVLPGLSVWPLGLWMAVAWFVVFCRQ